MTFANALEENDLESQLVLPTCSWGIYSGYSVEAATYKNIAKQSKIAVIFTISFSGVQLKLRFPALWRNMMFLNGFFVPTENLKSTLSNKL